MFKYSYVTRESYNRLKKELNYLKTEERQSVVRQIAEAREKGDLSENAEYDAAKEAQGLLELRIAKMEASLASIRIIKEEDLDASRVVVLSTVQIKNVKNNKEFSYTLVSESEADIKAKKISVSSPIGRGLLGKTVGEIARIRTPRGIVEFEILDIAINL